MGAGADVGRAYVCKSTSFFQTSQNYFANLRRKMRSDRRAVLAWRSLYCG